MTYRTFSILSIANAVAIGVIAIFAYLFAVEAGRAHTTDTGVVYPPSCCNSAATHAYGDCAPISSANVVAKPDGYHVTLAAGQHPKLKTKGYTAVIPYSLARPINDGQFHICLSEDGGARYCFFAPPPGA